jgi:Domain of unknown function (DUF1772)
MSAVGGLTARISAVLLGLFAGAMLAIGVALVPFWRRLSPAEFRAWFSEHSPRIKRIMYPLGVSATTSAIASVATGRGARNQGFAGGSALAACGVTGITLAVNEPANQRFATPGALTDEQTTALLERWMRWHWIRIALGVIACYAEVRAAEGR